MRKFLPVLIVFVIAFNGGSTRTRTAEANPVVILAPEVAVGMLEGLLVACTAAAAIGVISQQQNEEYHRHLQAAVDAIQDAVKKGLDATKEAVLSAVATIISVQSVIHSPAVCETLLRQAFNGSSNKTNAARAASEGECQPELRGDPFKCCPQFMKKFSGGSTLSAVGRNAFRIFSIGRNSITRRCCFEWDSLHGRFEVYETSNHDGVRHLGEKSCARDEDTNEDDICKATYTEKADLLSQRHAPRNGCQ